MTLSGEESQRYARHIVLKGIGGEGQNRLKAARVFVVGAGGLGSPVIAYLAAAGVGTLTIADDDAVAVSNLQRQMVHRTQDAGVNKAQSAARFVGDLNPHCRVEVHAVRLGRDTVSAMIADHDIVVDGSDTFDTRATVAQACEAATIPLVTGAVAQFDGQVTVVAPHLCDAEGNPLPRFADLYPTAPADDELPACELVGVLGVLPGIVGTMMANEAIKVITGFGPPLYGKLVIYSARTGETRTLRYRRSR